jgi:hypothetical protein
MKKAILATIMFLSSMSLYSDSSIGVRITAPIGNNGVIELGARSDDHRYNNRYKNFNYRKNAYYDDYGYYFGYFDILIMIDYIKEVILDQTMHTIDHINIIK